MPAEPYPENLDEEDGRFVTNFVSLQSIATSHAQNDSGLFELNFRDDRYLPFEGAGAISRWRIEMDKELAAFDFNSISDVVLHLKYTAREGGELLKSKAKDTLRKALADLELYPQSRAFSFQHEFPNEWVQLKQGKEVLLKNLQDRLPFFAQGRKITLGDTIWLARGPDGLKIKVNDEEIQLNENPELNKLLMASSSTLSDLQNVKLSIPDPATLESLIMMIQYKLGKKG
jgi:hypothetical protein